MRQSEQWKACPDHELEAVAFRIWDDLRAAQSQRTLDAIDQTLAEELYRRGLVVSYLPALYLNSHDGWTESVDMVLQLAYALVPASAVSLAGSGKAWVGNVRLGGKTYLSDGPYDSPAVALLLPVLQAWGLTASDPVKPTTASSVGMSEANAPRETDETQGAGR